MKELGVVLGTPDPLAEPDIVYTESERDNGTRRNTVYLVLGTRLRGQFDILRLMTRGLDLGLRGGSSSWRISVAKARKLFLACF